MNQPTLNRRDWLRTLAATGVTATGLGATAGAVAATAEQAWRSSFAPFDGGRATAMDADSIKIEGKLPAALQGTFYRNGPARFVLGQSRLTHWFDGDGMVQAIRFTDGKASHTGRLLQTPRRKEEDAAGRYLYPSFGSVPANAKRPRSADETNVSNISLLAIPKSKELFALWEAGSALSIDPQTLETRGTKVWSPETAGAAFSAHPKTAPDGTVWSFGYTPGSGKVIIYQISSVGQLMRQAVIEVPQANMVHDFAITENKLVFLLQPLVWSQDDWRKNGYFLGAMSWDAKAPLIAAVVSKTDWGVTFMDLPNGGVYHNGNAYEAGGKIHFAYPRIPEILPVSQHFDVVFGATEDASYRAFSSPWTLVELDLATKRATQTETEWKSTEFPRFDQRRTGEKTELTVLLNRSNTMNSVVNGMDTVLTLRQPKAGGAGSIQAQQYHYGNDWIAEEHQYIPHPTRTDESAGWIVGSAYHWPSEKTSIAVFEANALSKGPVAVLRLPYGLPLGLHGQFVAA